MEIIRDWRALPEASRRAAVALGNFDGVHRGHQRVIAAAADAAQRVGGPLGVIVFVPHPRVWFQPDATAFRLQTDGQRARALQALGVERLYELPFGAEMADMSDRDFVERVLRQGLGVSWVAAGFDITFGKDRSGTGEALAHYGERLGFGVTVVSAVTDAEGAKLSSSAVRQALADGRPELAAAILGRPFAIEGEVVHGAKRGRALGFPTANINLGDYVQPRFGVYATRTRLPDGRIVEGVSNLGVNPQFGGEPPQLETWLFDFDADLYGQVLESELIAFLRPEARFDTVETMTRQVFADADQARALLSAAVGAPTHRP